MADARICETLLVTQASYRRTGGSMTSCLVTDVDKLQGGSNMTGTDLCVNKPHCAAAVRP